MYFEEDSVLLFSNNLLLIVKFLFAVNILIMDSRSLSHAVSMATAFAIGLAANQVGKALHRGGRAMVGSPVGGSNRGGNVGEGSEIEMPKRSDPVDIPEDGVILPKPTPVVSVDSSATSDAPTQYAHEGQIEANNESLVDSIPDNRLGVSKSPESEAETTVKEFMDSEFENLFREINDFIKLTKYIVTEECNEFCVSESDASEVIVEELNRIKESVEIKLDGTGEQFRKFIEKEFKESIERIVEFKESKAE